MDIAALLSSGAGFGRVPALLAEEAGNPFSVVVRR
jgi:hypothetical protein